MIYSCSTQRISTTDFKIVFGQNTISRLPSIRVLVSPLLVGKPISCNKACMNNCYIFYCVVLVNCPPGTFDNNGACEKCAVGSYQDKEKQLSCKKCPADHGTLTSGARKCHGKAKILKRFNGQKSALIHDKASFNHQ